VHVAHQPAPVADDVAWLGESESGYQVAEAAVAKIIGSARNTNNYIYANIYATITVIAIETRGASLGSQNLGCEPLQSAMDLCCAGGKWKSKVAEG
jgi:hypothetical protein